MNAKHVTTFKTYTGHYRRRYLLPAGFLLASFLLMILPLEGFISSVKVVLAYVFIPPVRAAHSTVRYAQNVSDTVQDLLRAHQENEQLKQEIKNTRLLAMQTTEVFAQNERLSQMVQFKPAVAWKGVWAQVVYREPAQWNNVILDKGSKDGIQERSAVISVEDGQEGLAGVVVEVTENTSKVLLVRDEDFSAAVRLKRTGEEGLLSGNGPRPVLVKYLPLQASVQKGDEVFTSSSSSVFPAGILVGHVSAVHSGENFQTSQTVEVTPQVRSSAVQEVFVLLGGK